MCYAAQHRAPDAGSAQSGSIGVTKRKTATAQGDICAHRALTASHTLAHALRCVLRDINEVDSCALQDRIGWRRCHVVGFSMGGMVACRLAAAHPALVASLTTVSSTLGGWSAVPRSFRAWKFVAKVALDGSPRTRAEVDLKFHFTKSALKECVPLPALLCACGGSVVHIKSAGPVASVKMT